MDLYKSMPLQLVEKVFMKKQVRHIAQSAES